MKPMPSEQELRERFWDAIKEEDFATVDTMLDILLRHVSRPQVTPSEIEALAELVSVSRSRASLRRPVWALLKKLEAFTEDTNA